MVVNILVVRDGVVDDPVLRVGPLPPAAGHVRVLQGVLSLVPGDNLNVYMQEKVVI